MKKLLAMLLCAVMMLSTCAFAGGGITLKDVVLFEGDEALLDLSGLGVRFETYRNENNDDVGLKIAFEAADQEALSLALAYMGEKLLLSMSGVSGVYSVDFDALRELASDELGEAAVSAMPDFEVKDVLESEWLAESKTLLEKAGEMLESGEVDGEQVTIEGESYERSAISLSAEQCDELLLAACAIADKYAADLIGGGGSLADVYKQFDIDFIVDGEYFEGEAYDIVNGALSVVSEGIELAVVTLYAEILEDEAADETGVYLEMEFASGTESYGMSLGLELTDDDNSAWMPDADVEAKDLLAALEDETQLQKLTTEALSAAMMAISYAASANETVGMLLTGAMNGEM